jgi:hypothetical protein
MEDQAKTNLDDFNYWVADMDDALARFFDTLPASLRSKLNYSPESLEALERWILARYPSIEAARAAEESRIIDGLARYVGETFRKNAGGHWDINLDNPKAAFFSVPILTGFRTPICPLALVTASTDRRTGRFIRTVLDNNLRRPTTDTGERH